MPPSHRCRRLHTGDTSLAVTPTTPRQSLQNGCRCSTDDLTTVAIVLVVILFLAAPLRYLPNAALAAIVFSIGLKLIDIKGMTDVLRTHREEFCLMTIAAATVVFIGVKEGIIVAVVLSLILHVYHSYRPHSAVLIPGDNRFWQPVPAHPGTVSAPGLIIYRFSRDLFYANTTYFSEQVKSLVHSAVPVKCFILEARAITEIDYSAAQTIRDGVKELAMRKVTFMVSGLAPDVKAQFDRDGLLQLIGRDRFFNHLEEALAVFDCETSTQ
jgi:sulfate permease, SulP family